MMDLVVEDLDPSALSLCQHCAKPEALKRFVVKHGEEGVRCGICLNVSVNPETCSLSQRQALTYLLRAMVRFYYNEDAYNTHLGAESSPARLLQSSNPVLETASTPGFSRSNDRSWVLLEEVFDNDVYPPPDEGVAVYAGFGPDNYRGFNQSLQTSDERLAQLCERLESENYFDVEPELTTLIENLAGRISTTIAAGQTYFRARRGVQARYLRFNENSFHADIVYEPYQREQLGARKPQGASVGRLNRQGVAFLYLATDASTACTEVRPHPSQLVSVGQYRSTRSLRLANLDADIADFATSDTDLELYAFVYAANQAMSIPVLPGEEDGYSITQLLADVLRQKGFDGIAFKSSLEPDGRNICIFRPADFEYIEGSAQVRRVERVSYTLSDVLTVQGPEVGDQKLA